jgi:hypothetical protein
MPHPMRMKAVPLLLVALWLGVLPPAVAAPAAGDAGTFHGTVYQIDTISNFVDVIMPGGTKRFYADPATIVRVHRKRASLIDIAMGEEVRGTYRTNAKGLRTVVTIDDETGN